MHTSAGLSGDLNPIIRVRMQVGVGADVTIRPVQPPYPGRRVIETLEGCVAKKYCYGNQSTLSQQNYVGFSKR